MRVRKNIKRSQGEKSDEENPFLMPSPIEVDGKDLLERAVELVYRQGGNKDLNEVSFLAEMCLG